MMWIILIVAGGVLMLFGICMLWGWVDGKAGWFDVSVFDRSGSSKTDRQFLDLHYIAIVLAPLLVGVIMLAYGLQGLR